MWNTDINPWMNMGGEHGMDKDKDQNKY